MKRALILTLLLAAGAFAGSARADDEPAACPMGAAPPEPTLSRVAMLVQSERHLEVALQTTTELLADGPTLLAEVVVCGTAVDRLAAAAPSPALEQALKAGVDVAACGLSLEQRGVAPSALRPGVRVVPNGLVELLQRDAEGYATVEL